MSADEQLAPSIVTGDWTLTPVLRVSCHCSKLGGFVYARGDKRVVALLVRHGERQWRVELPGDGNPTYIPTPPSPG